MQTSYLKLLFWLKWKLMWRMYRRERMAAVGLIIGLLVIGPWAFIGAGLCLFGFLTFEPPLNQHLLAGALTGAYLFWLLVPMMGYALNDSYDITRLFVYPISVRQILTGAILGSIVDFPVLFLLP